MKKRFLITLVVAALICSGAVFAGGTQESSSDAADGEQLVVGFSQMETDSTWRITETKSVKEEAKKRGVKLIYTDAQGDTAKQVADVEDIVAQNPDYLLLAPREYEALTPALQAAKEAGVPVILLDRDAAGTPGVDFVTVIRADFIWEGAECAKKIAKHFDGKEANIVQLTGTPGASVTEDRQVGFEEELAKYPNLHLIATQVGNFNRADAMTTMENVLQTYGDDIDAVYGHSDEEGIGAIQAIKGAGKTPGKDIQIVSIAGYLDALKAIVVGDMLASIECSPYFGQAAFDTIEKLENGETVPTFIQNPGKVYDISNAQSSIDAGEGF